ncbi:MAG: pantetheine-phosphate adenylyltransferase [Clostridia bacterium]|nr:pantetheine-phosphate adenylyltransferase [Clostridia bacterium]
MKKGLYAGSFDPITAGHLDVINRASKLCDTLVVGVIRNPSKKSEFKDYERISMIKESTTHLTNIEIDIFDGLLADYVLKHNIDVVVRGLRATMDFDYEIQMAQMNARLYENKAETIFFMTNPSHSFISSSLVREVFALGGNIKDLVPDCVLNMMKSKSKRSKGE